MSHNWETKKNPRRGKKVSGKPIWLMYDAANGVLLLTQCVGSAKVIIIVLGSSDYSHH